MQKKVFDENEALSRNTAPEAGMEERKNFNRDAGVDSFFQTSQMV